MERAQKKHEREIEYDANGAPILVKVSNHLVTLERMHRFRASALVEQAESPQVLFHYAKEKTALACSLAALRYHRAVIQRMPEPLGLLRQLVDAVERGEHPWNLLEEARKLLKAYPTEAELTEPANDYPETAAR